MPALAGPVFDALTVESFTHPGYAAVRAAIAAAGGTSAGVIGRAVDRGRARADRFGGGREPGHANSAWNPSGSTTTTDCRATSAACWPGCRKCAVGRQIAEVKSKLQRMSPVEQGDEYHALFGDLVALEAYRRSLLEQASGDDLTA